MERGRGCTSWIKFGEISLRCLLEGAEACCREEESLICNRVWKENGKAYKLERCANRARRFIFVFVCDVEGIMFNCLPGRKKIDGEMGHASK